MKTGARGTGRSPTQRRSRCTTGAVRGRRLPSHRAEGALRPRGPAHRRSDACARPAPVAAASPRATDVRPPAGPACRHTCASRRGPCCTPRRVARGRAARANPGFLTLKPGSTTASIRQTDASAAVSREASVARAADRTCLWAIAIVRRSADPARSGRSLGRPCNRPMPRPARDQSNRARRRATALAAGRLRKYERGAGELRRAAAFTTRACSQNEFQLASRRPCCPRANRGRRRGPRPVYAGLPGDSRVLELHGHRALPPLC
jgi:hypothetical protein